MRKEAKAAIEWVVEANDESREKRRKLLSGLKGLVKSLIYISYPVYLFIISFLISKPGLPLFPTVTSTNSEYTIERFLPFGRHCRNWSSMPSIRIPQVLKCGTVGGIMVPDCQLEEDCSKAQQYLR